MATTTRKGAARRGATGGIPAAPARPTTPAARSARAAGPTRARKNMRLSQTLLDAAKEALGLSDETETVTTALERVVTNRRAADGILALGGRYMLDASRIEDA